ncbi:hypothetical protein RN001_015616 [Aquatica leii]|uniref:Secreted protein n=1 Tax=Aquatica leii TaxID=1421715 RepID=A0AAN7PN90_9COLE|nr:hypothetical protein RN001_015616 [Aquatica leii]
MPIDLRSFSVLCILGNACCQSVLAWNLSRSVRRCVRECDVRVQTKGLSRRLAILPKQAIYYCCNKHSVD